eukprot:5362161-Karenia_brevis.AAC.1
MDAYLPIDRPLCSFPRLPYSNAPVDETVITDTKVHCLFRAVCKPASADRIDNGPARRRGIDPVKPSHHAPARVPSCGHGLHQFHKLLQNTLPMARDKI